MEDCLADYQRMMDYSHTSGRPAELKDDVAFWRNKYETGIRFLNDSNLIIRDRSGDEISIASVAEIYNLVTGGEFNNEIAKIIERLYLERYNIQKHTKLNDVDVQRANIVYRERDEDLLRFAIMCYATNCTGQTAYEFAVGNGIRKLMTPKIVIPGMVYNNELCRWAPM